MDVLTETQKKKLNEILGKPFDVSLVDREIESTHGSGK